MTHRVVGDWMDKRVETLEDLLRPGLRAVCVGINPAPVSVAAGHYFYCASTGLEAHVPRRGQPSGAWKR